MASEYTPNYNLDLYVSTDKPNLRDQYNAAMGKIDTQMKKNADDTTNASANVVTLQSQMATANENITALQGTVGELQTDVEGNTSEIASVKQTAEAAQSESQANASEIETIKTDATALTGRVTAVETESSGNATAITGLQSRVGTVETDLNAAESTITEVQGDVTELTSQLAGKAPTNHASSANTYGQGSATNFGHVKVADSGSAAASSGTAASPKMVSDQIAALKTALAPTAIIAAKTVNYSNGINGNGTFSVYGNSITKVVSVQLDNTSLSSTGAGGWASTTLGNLPAGWRPTRLMCQLALGDWGYLIVEPDGEVRLSVSNDTQHSAGTNNGAGVVYFANQ